MEILVSIGLILAGLTVVLWGANSFTDGAGALARKFNVSELVIGLTVVALGTSAPELSVSLMAQLNGASGMAVGNVIGSNIFNTLAIVGVTSMVAPILITKETVRRDMPWCVLAAALLFAFIQWDNVISRLEAIVMLLCFAVFMFFTFRNSKAEQEETAATTDTAKIKLWVCLLRIVAGLAALIIGSRLFVNGASDVASALNVSDAVIGLTVAAWGTSLPELATSVSAARKGQSGLAIGNVVGSNIFNILFILGLTGTVRSIDAGGFTLVDLIVMLASVPLLWLFTRTKYRVSRWEGAVLTLVFAVYTVWLVLNA